MIITYVLVISAMLIEKQEIDEPIYTIGPFRTEASCRSAETEYNKPAFRVRIARCVPVLSGAKVSTTN